MALAAVLLVAWQASLEHPVEHVGELGELVHVHDGHAHDSEPGAVCDLLAALAACAPAAHAVFPEAFCAYASPGYPESAPRAAEAPPFFSQGPPASV